MTPFRCWLMAVFVAAIHLTTPKNLLSQNHADRFLIDGDIGDFKEVPHHFYKDTMFHPDTGINIRQVYTAHDDRYFYIGFTSQKTLNLTGGNPRKGQVYLYLDTDQKRKTGYLTGALGADITVDFTRKIVRWNQQPESAIQLDQAGIRLMPTTSDTTFEVAIARKVNVEHDTVHLDDRISWQIADQRGDETLPAYDSAFQYRFKGQKVAASKPIELAKPAEDGFRLVSHNTLNNGLINEDRAPYLRRIYRFLKPDVVTLNECWDVSAPKAQRFFNTQVTKNQSKSWHAVKLDEGNIILSRYTMGRKWHINDSFRLSAAMVQHPDEPFMLINAHLSCCDQNQKRKKQARALMEFIDDAQEPGGRLSIQSGTPIVVAGDMNLVGEGITKAMLTGDTTAIKGFKPDWDYTSLNIAGTPHSHGRFTYTWQSLESGWPAGKLDYICFTGSVLNLINHYTFITQKLPDDLLKQGTLDAHTTSNASDHYPLVADFRFQAAQEGDTGFKQLSPYLDQSSSHTISFDKKMQHVAIYNQYGKLMMEEEDRGQILLPLAKWPAGKYYIKLKQMQGTERVQSFLLTP